MLAAAPSFDKRDSTPLMALFDRITTFSNPTAG
jgi:hypothetical protein